jgi:site-specific recombinase XerD
MDRAALSPLLRSFERHLRAENRSGRTIASYLESTRQAEAFLAARGTSLTAAGRVDLEAFLGELLQRRAAGTRYKVLRILYRWLEKEDEIDDYGSSVEREAQGQALWRVRVKVAGEGGSCGRLWVW